MDTKNKEISTNKQLLEDAKAKLRWYTLEASEEQFDQEEVDLLVTLINKLEPQPKADPQEVEKELERFRAYVNLYREDEAARKQVNAENNRKKAGRIWRFHGKGVLVAAAVFLVLLLVAGSSLGEVNADDNNGFFYWLKKDKKGILAVTSPTQTNMELEKDVDQKYGSIEEVPEEYRQYVIEADAISLLQEYTLEGYLCKDASTFHKFNEVFVNLNEEKEISLGVLIYPEHERIIRDTFENYVYMYTNTVGERAWDVFQKEEKSGKLEYMLLFYEDNKKYFVSGNADVELLENVLKEYLNLVLD